MDGDMPCRSGWVLYMTAIMCGVVQCA